MKKRDTKTLASRWFDKANNLWHYTQAAFNQTKLTAPFCFDCQQVVEFYLKGFLVLNNIKPPRTHNLPSLLKFCLKTDNSFTEISEDCKNLTKYYIPTRYPTYPFPEYSIKEVEEARKSVEKIISFVDALGRR